MVGFFSKFSLVRAFVFCLFLVISFVGVNANERINLNKDLVIEDYELIVDFKYKNHTLNRDVFIYTLPETTLIPLQYLVDALEFPIVANPLDLTVSGWFINTENTLDIDFKTKTIYLKGEALDFPENVIVYSDGIDLYLETQFIETLTGLTLVLNTSRLRLEIDSSEKLAFEKKLDREKSRNKSLNRSEKTYRQIDDQYHGITPPILDLTVGANFIDEEGAFYTFQSSMDTLFFESYFSSTQVSGESSSSERITLRKSANNPDSLMAGKLSFIELGDTFAKSTPLVLDGGQGQGINLDFGTVVDVDAFGTSTIEGEATPGWEVELYRNGVLIDFIQVDESAKYQFNDVELNYGDNVFDIRLYGPLGQVENRREQINIGDQMLSEGDTGVSLSYVETDNFLIDEVISDTPSSKTDVFIKHGVAKNLSLGGGVSRIKIQLLDESWEEQDYLNLGVISAADGINLSLDYTDQLDKGWAGSVTGQASLFEVSTTFKHMHFSNFASDRNSDGELEDESEIRFGGSLQPAKWRPLQINLKATREKYLSGRELIQFESQLGVQVFSGALTLTNTLSNPSEGDQASFGRVSYSQSILQKALLRTSFNYDVKPDTSFKDSDINLTWYPAPNVRANLAAFASFESNHNNSISYSISKIFDFFSVSLSGDSNEKGENELRFSVETSFAPTPRQVHVSGQSQVNNGRLQLRSFIDNDLSSDWSEGDEPIAGVGLYGRSDWHNIKTDDEGYAYFPNLTAGYENKVIIDERSIEDPFWKVNFPPSKVYSHAGGVTYLDVPVIITVELEGTVVGLFNGVEKSLPNIPVLAVQNGEVVASVKTEFDGYYVFTGLIPGTYSIELESSYLSRFGLAHKTFKQDVAADTDEGVFYAEPFVLDILKP